MLNDSLFKNAQVAPSSLFDELTDLEKKQSDLRGRIAAMILNERTRRNMTQEAFAQFMGVRQSMVSRWESCGCNLTIDKLAEICDKLDISLQITMEPGFVEETSSVPAEAESFELSFADWSSKSFSKQSTMFPGIDTLLPAYA